VRPPIDSIQAPPFPPAPGWVNSEPLEMGALRGGPVLIEFWDFCRPNSLRTRPYLDAWHERYAPEGLVIIGAHAPGFRASSREQAAEEAVARLGVDDLESLVSMTEAAVAYREGLESVAATLADRAHLLWSRMGKRWAAFFARSLAVAAGAPADDVAALVAEALACPLPGLGVQALALLRRAGHAVAVEPADLDRVVAGVPADRWALRMDVLSVEEALASLRGASR